MVEVSWAIAAEGQRSSGPSPPVLPIHLQTSFFVSAPFNWSEMPWGQVQGWLGRSLKSTPKMGR